MKRSGAVILGVLLLVGLVALLHQPRETFVAASAPRVVEDSEPNQTVSCKKAPQAVDVQLPVQSELPAENIAPVPFGSRAVQSSVQSIGDLFQPEQERAFENTLPPEDLSRLVKLKSRFFVSAPLSGETLASGTEYYLTFTSTPDDQVRQQLEEQGVHLVEHITRTTWRAVANSSASLSGMKTLTGAEPVWPVDKWSPQLWGKVQNASAQTEGFTVLVSISDKIGSLEVDSLFTSAGVTPLDGTAQQGKRLFVQVDRTQLLALCGSPLVSGVELPPPPKKTFNLNAAKLTNVDDIQAWPYDLTGTNINIMIRDGGEVAPHPDYNGRVTMVESNGVHYHATHVAGTLAGSGAGNAAAKGMAPKAQLYSYDFYGDDASELLDAKNNYTALLSNHSYGYVIGWEGSTWYDNTSLFGDYTTETRTWDAVVKDNELYIFKAAGNDRNDTGTGHPHDGTLYGDDYYDCMETVSGAKNIITVGAVDSAGAMSSFSNFGPTDDGRIKPDIVADGVAVLSTWTNSNYASMNGTSMATPAACGATALLLEQYRALNSNDWPSVAYLKGLLIHTAKDMGRPGPDYAFGWGLLDAKAAVDFILSSSSGVRVREEVVSENQTNRYSLNISGGVTNLRVTLYWTDAAGSTTAADALVNDLDVRLIAPDSNTVYFPYVMPFEQSGASPTNPAVPGTNHADNVEQINVISPTSGVWTVEVKGTLIPSGTQDYAIFFNAGDVDVPQINLSSTELPITVAVGQTGVVSVVVSNSGDANLVFSLTDDSGAGNYTWKDSDAFGGPAYSWIDISESGVAVSLTDDGETSLIGMAFDFPFYGQDYSQIQIGANGVVSLVAGEVDYAHYELPSSSIPSKSLAILWADFDPGSGGSILYDSSPERFVVSWIAVPLWSTTSYQTFQVILYPDGRIIYQYDSLSGNFASSTVGLQDGGLSAQVAYNTNYLASSLAVEFFTPEPTWLSYVPSNGILTAANSTSLWFTADASELSAGVYSVNVTVESNDPDTPEIILPVILTVPEPDTDGDTLPDSWEELYFGGATNANPSALCSNGVNTVLEAYVAGIDPTNSASVFVMTQLGSDAGNIDRYVLQWPPVTGRVYTVYWTSNLFSEFTLLQSNITAGAFTDTVHSTDADGFYRIEVDLAP